MEPGIKAEATKHNFRAKIIRLLLLILVVYLILQILNKYFPSSMILLYNKLGQNSRSHQYFEIAKASTFFGWLFGNGATAVYYDSAQGYIANIDNQYIFISFHYGIVFMLMWLMNKKVLKKKIPVGFKSAIVYLFATVFTRGLAIITTPIFTRIMSTDQVGMVNLYSSWYSMITVVSTLALTSGGFFMALREFESERDQYVSSVLSLTSLVAIGLVFLYALAPSFWNRMTGLPTHLMILLLVGLLVAPARDFWLSRQRFEYRYKLSGAVTIVSAVAASGLAVVAVLYANSIDFSDIASVRLFANYSIVYGVAAVIWFSIFLNTDMKSELLRVTHQAYEFFK